MEPALDFRSVNVRICLQLFLQKWSGILIISGLAYVFLGCPLPYSFINLPFAPPKVRNWPVFNCDGKRSPIPSNHSFVYSRQFVTGTRSPHTFFYFLFKKQKKKKYIHLFWKKKSPNLFYFLDSSSQYARLYFLKSWMTFIIY